MTVFPGVVVVVVGGGDWSGVCVYVCVERGGGGGERG